MEAENALRRTEFYRVLYRPSLMLGGEREPVLVTLVTAVGLAMSGLNAVSIGFAVALWFVGIGVFRLMAKADPYMSQVYMRQLAYRVYYAARSRPARTE
ncbi:MAG: conjugal transfer protein TrbD [Terracidiphilus sp.]|nr:conjugal transfer protein TrbD [Terracidiphilus sp.]